jgi:hypothetical protein
MVNVVSGLRILKNGKCCHLRAWLDMPFVQRSYRAEVLAESETLKLGSPSAKHPKLPTAQLPLPPDHQGLAATWDKKKAGLRKGNPGPKV